MSAINNIDDEGGTADIRVAGALDPASDVLVDLNTEQWGALQRIGRSLHVREHTLEATLGAVLDAAVDLINGTAAAGLNLLVRGHFVPQALRGRAPEVLDRLQIDNGDGPCIAASAQQTTVRVDDMTQETRWPEFARAADELGVRAMLCVPLFLDETHLGSLSLYAESARSYRDHEVELARLLATHAAVAIADAQLSENLQIALANRDVIGQAKGILMERHRLTPDQAFQLLVKASQSANRKLADIARDFTETGEVSR